MYTTYIYAFFYINNLNSLNSYIIQESPSSESSATNMPTIEPVSQDEEMNSDDEEPVSDR